MVLNLNKEIIEAIFFYILIAGIIFLVFFLIRKRWKTKIMESHFIKWWERGEVVHKTNTGFRITKNKRLGREETRQGVIINAVSGGGKSSGFVIPNILEAPNDSSIICTDIKGELFKKTSGYMKERGFKILKIDLKDPASSNKINLLERNINNFHNLSLLCHQIAESASSKSSDPIWSISAQDLLFILSHALGNYSLKLQNENKERNSMANFENLRLLVNKFGTAELDNFLAENITDDLVYSDYEMLKKMTGTSMMSSVLQTTRASLTIFRDPVVRQITSSDDQQISLEQLRKNPTILYIVVPKSKIQYYSLFLSLLWQYVFGFLAEDDQDLDNKIDTILMLEEFGQLYIQNFETLATTVRSNKCSNIMVLQDPAQLEDKYGAVKARIIRAGGASTKIYMSGNTDYSLNEEVSKNLGEIWEEKDGRIVKERLLSPDGVRTLGKENFICIHGGFPPLKMELNGIYQNSSLLAKTKIPVVKIKNKTSQPSPLLDLSQWADDEENKN